MTSPNTTERLREEFRDFGLEMSLSSAEELGIVSDWWLAKLEQECQRRENELRKELLREVDKIEETPIETPEHECHLMCCGVCYCTEQDFLIKKSAILALLTPDTSDKENEK